MGTNDNPLVSIDYSAVESLAGLMMTAVGWFVDSNWLRTCLVY